ncbi:hypothetical protein ACJX0J_041581, partial [Zea mays]
FFSPPHRVRSRATARSPALLGPTTAPSSPSLHTSALCLAAARILTGAEGEDPAVVDGAAMSLTSYEGALRRGTDYDRILASPHTHRTLLGLFHSVVLAAAAADSDSSAKSSEAHSFSNDVKTVLGSGTQYANGFAVADIKRLSLILCAIVKDALTAMTALILSARGGLPVPGWILSLGGSIVLLFAPVEIMMSCVEIHIALLSIDCGAVISSKGSTVLFPTKASKEPKLLTKPSAVIIISYDSSGAIPSICKPSPGQAAYHFLAGYHDGKFIPAYSKAPSSVDPLALASSLFSH